MKRKKKRTRNVRHYFRLFNYWCIIGTFLSLSRGIFGIYPMKTRNRKILSRQKRKNVILKKRMVPLRYRFNDIFFYNPTTGVLIPRYTVIINNVRYFEGIPIANIPAIGRLNLYDYIGRDFLGEWNPTARELTVSGFY